MDERRIWDEEMRREEIRKIYELLVDAKVIAFDGMNRAIKEGDEEGIIFMRGLDSLLKDWVKIVNGVLKMASYKERKGE